MKLEIRNTFHWSRCDEENFDLAVGVRPFANQPRREDLGVIDHEQIVWLDIIHDIGNMTMLQHACIAVEHHHLFRASLLDRMLRDQPFRERIPEE